jgi:hypothetical protein
MLIAENLPFNQVFSSCFEHFKDLDLIAPADDFEQAQIRI